MVSTTDIPVISTSLFLHSLVLNCVLAAYQVELMENLGNTFIFRLFWNDVIVTAEPENIKVWRYLIATYDSLTALHNFQAILASDFSSFEKGTSLFSLYTFETADWNL